MANKIPVLVWTVCVLAIISNGECASRQKRNLLQFADMIKCAAERSAWDYNGYGCYCGKGGGGTAVDATDRCCKTHDRCYDGLKKAKTCTSGNLYFLTRTYSLSSCGTNYAQITCLPSPHEKRECAEGLCECDREAALCFRENRDTFNDEYVRYINLWNC